MKTRNIYFIGLLFVVMALVGPGCIFQPNAMAMDDTSTMRCDGGIVAAGDSEDSVREKCGDPQQVLRPDPQEPVKWVYNFGDTQFTNFVSIVNGKVERIQIGKYGDQ
jgi:hypothetical protein